MGGFRGVVASSPFPVVVIPKFLTVCPVCGFCVSTVADIRVGEFSCPGCAEVLINVNVQGVVSGE